VTRILARCANFSGGDLSCIGTSDGNTRFARILAVALLATERIAVRNWMEERVARPLATLIRERSIR